jgi:hypothetical protein
VGHLFNRGDFMVSAGVFIYVYRIPFFLEFFPIGRKKVAYLSIELGINFFCGIMFKKTN